MWKAEQCTPELTRTPPAPPLPHVRATRTSLPRWVRYRRRRAACPQGPPYCTCGVRVPALGVGYVPRTVASQAGANAAGIHSLFVAGGIHAAEVGLGSEGDSEDAGGLRADALERTFETYGANPTYSARAFTW